MIKKIIPIILCCIMLVACGSQPVTLLDFIGEESKLTYDGRTFVVYSDEGENGINLLAYDNDQSMQADAMRNRISYIESEFDTDIELSSKGHADFDQYYITSIGSGLKPVDFFYRGNDNSLWDLADAGVLLPMTNFPDYIDLSDEDKYGTPGVLEAAMINGVPYAVQPTYWPGLQGVECCLITYNADRFQTLGLTPLHEYYENKTWTWDTFLTYCDTSAPLVSVENGEYIFSSREMYLLNMMFFANGFDFVDINDGVPKLNLFADSAVHSIEFYQKLLSYGDVVEYCDSHHDYDSFINEKAITKLALAQSLITGKIAYDSNFSYNIMPFPCGPDVEYGQWAQTVTRIFGLAIPISADDPDACAHIISELAEPFEDFGGNREGVYQYYRENVFLSELDVDIFFDVEQYVRFDYDDADLLFDYVDEIAIGAKNSSASELIQKYAPAAERIYEKYIKSNLTGYIIEHMGLE